MAYAFVQETDGQMANNSATTSMTVKYPSNSTAGNRGVLVLWPFDYNGGSTATQATVTSVSDAKNGAWHQEYSLPLTNVSTVKGTIYVYTVQLASALTTTDNITISTTGGSWNFGWYSLLEYSVLGTGISVLDVSAGQQIATSTSNPSTGTSANTTGASELDLVIYVDDGDGLSWSTAPTGTARCNHMSDLSVAELWVGEKSSGASGTGQSGSGTLSGNVNVAGMAVVALKLAGGAAFIAPQPLLVRQAGNRSASY